MSFLSPEKEKIRQREKYLFLQLLFDEESKKGKKNAKMKKQKLVALCLTMLNQTIKTFNSSRFMCELEINVFSLWDNNRKLKDNNM